MRQWLIVKQITTTYKYRDKNRVRNSLIYRIDLKTEDNEKSNVQILLRKKKGWREKEGYEMIKKTLLKYFYSYILKKKSHNLICHSKNMQGNL